LVGVPSTLIGRALVLESTLSPSSFMKRSWSALSYLVPGFSPCTFFAMSHYLLFLGVYLSPSLLSRLARKPPRLFIKSPLSSCFLPVYPSEDPTHSPSGSRRRRVRFFLKSPPEVSLPLPSFFLMFFRYSPPPPALLLDVPNGSLALF